MSYQWGSMPRVPEAICFPLNSARIIALIVIVYAAIAIVFAVVTLTWATKSVPGALTAVASTAILSEEIARRLAWCQHPHTT